MNKAEWMEVDRRLHSFYDSVKLICDGYQVSLALVRIDQFHNAITFYINGVFKGEWAGKDCEERRRFMRLCKRPMQSRKERENLKKMPKRMLKDLQKESKWFDPDWKYTYYSSYWTSFSALKSHLIKNNSNIELIKDERSERDAAQQQPESPPTCCQSGSGAGG